MIPWRLVTRNILRRPLRTALTGATIAAAILVFASLLSVNSGVHQMIDATGNDAVVIAFERYKACPPFSRLPVHYGDQIAGMPHVREVMPVRFLLSSCRTTTDLVALHGVDPEKLRQFRALGISEAEYEAFADERGAALVGRALAERYDWRVGETVSLAELRGISFVIRGIHDAPGSSLNATILVDREFLEYSIDQVGVATMFMVLVDDAAHVDAVSREIDATFANYPAQTRSGPERDFIANMIEDFLHMVAFSQVVAYLALFLLLGAVANSISMSVRERLREMALLKTRGFGQGQVTAIVLAEAMLISLGAASIGLLATVLVFATGRFTIGVEGYTITPHLSTGVVALSLAAGAALGLAGALMPAIRGARLPIRAGLSEAGG